METGNFVAWVGAIALITTTALAALFWAYVGSGSRTVRFTEPVTAPALGEGQVYTDFQQGYEAFKAGKYGQARDRFSQTLKTIPTFAEAYHNLGLIQANLQRDNEAARSLVKAGELYLERSDSAGYERVKRDLEQMKG